MCNKCVNFVKVNFSDSFRHLDNSIIQARTLVPGLKGVHTMSNKEKLIQYIHNLTNEDAEKITSFLKSTASPEEVSQLLPQNNSLQEQATAS